MKLDDVEKLVKLLEKSDLNELYWSEGDKKLVLKKGGAVLQAAPAPVSLAPAPVAAPQAVVDSAPVADGLKEVTSPMVGTFYSSASPDVAAFVSVGDKVTKGQTLCIVEAMKLMNEIESEVTGVIKEICVDNESPVEFGTVLFKVAE